MDLAGYRIMSAEFGNVSFRKFKNFREKARDYLSFWRFFDWRGLWV